MALPALFPIVGLAEVADGAGAGGQWVLSATVAEHGACVACGVRVRPFGDRTQMILVGGE